MIDFSRLKIRTPEERAADEQRRVAEATAADLRQRRQRCKKSLTITPGDDLWSQFTHAGNQVVRFNGFDAQQRPIRLSWFAPDFAERAMVDKIIDQLAPGVEVTVKGYWQPNRTSDGSTSFTFVAQFIEPVFPDPDATAGEAAPSPDARSSALQRKIDVL